ncbi:MULTISPECIES: glycosyltransferase family 2 protein [Croceibacter]|uniref:glycosyltransferase family 2 protein n=1 Tax=Croceibacter TaxID=216431 RepID=UPI000C41764B|nr:MULTISPECIES: glycosyltransferase [Croceibacter]MBG24875.1 hypothetical protein [Croceibacter sp.]|tara:strand:+ start:2304 stop:3242 length:939 start_codon:yes stop_codon:yes gene_type:complete
MKNITVSVIMTTYKHEDYIESAINGILMQVCNFNFELIIADDHSPDATQEIVQKIIKKHPKGYLIKYQRHKKNKGLISNFKWCLEQSNAKYIALCEGDDYWISSDKLQKQINVLDKNPDINICSHPSLCLYGTTIKNIGYGFHGKRSRIIRADKVIKNYASTAPFQSIVFRRGQIDEFSSLTDGLLGVHSTVQIFYAIPNGLYYLSEIMSVYRVESSSSISKELFKSDDKYLARQFQNWCGLDKLNRASNFKFDKEFKCSKKYRALDILQTGKLKPYEIYKIIVKLNLYFLPFRLFKSLVINTILKLKRKIV